VYGFSTDPNGVTKYIFSFYTGISVGIPSASDYALLKALVTGQEPTTTSAQRALVQSYLTQLNPVTITALNGAVLNLASDNASQTTNLTNQLNTISHKIDNLPH
jgi:hypothetical protein